MAPIGLLALAFATSGASPSAVSNNQNLMRNRLLDCSMNNLLLYTATAMKRCPTSEVKIDVFCNCRLPQGAKRMWLMVS